MTVAHVKSAEQDHPARLLFLRDSRAARAFCLGVRGIVRISIEQVLALRASEQGGCALEVR